MGIKYVFLKQAKEYILYTREGYRLSDRHYRPTTTSSNLWLYQNQKSPDVKTFFPVFALYSREKQYAYICFWLNIYLGSWFGES